MVRPELTVSRARELLSKNRAALSSIIKEINRINKRTPEEVRTLEAQFPQSADEGNDVPAGEADGQDGSGTPGVDDGSGVPRMDGV